MRLNVIDKDKRQKTKDIYLTNNDINSYAYTCIYADVSRETSDTTTGTDTVNTQQKHRNSFT